MPRNMMKAIRIHEFGGPEVLRYEDAPLPELKAGEVLVRVHAIGLNPPDWYLREGYKMLPPEWQPQVSFPRHPGNRHFWSCRGGRPKMLKTSPSETKCIRWFASPAALQGTARPMLNTSACRYRKLH